VLIIDNLTVNYGKGDVISSLSFTFKEGNIYGIIGENGIGKTTLLNAISNIINYRGVIYSDIVNNHLESLLYLPTNLFFYPKMTGEEYIKFYLKAKNKQFVNIDSWNDKFKLPLKQYVSSYSAGMQKRLALMVILMIQGYLMVLDEPFNSLDEYSVKLVTQELLNINQSTNNIIIIASHGKEILKTLCSEIYILSKSSLLKVS
jgi:ABC-2 type transport system ATP-binding protein